MPTLQNTFDGGTVGATITEANSGGASGTPFNYVEILAGATATYQSTSAMHGGRGCKITGSGAHAFLEHDLTTTYTQMSFRFYVRFPSAPTANCQIFTPRSSADYVAGVNITTALKFQAAQVGGTVLFTSATLTANTWYRVEMVVETGTTTANGAIAFKYFLGDSTTAVESFSSTTANTSLLPMTMYRIGKVNNTGSTPMDIDSITFNTGSDLFLGPHVDLNIPPVANAGTGGTDIEPGSTVTLNGTGSTDPDGSITSYSWTQTSGISVTISGSGASRTFTAPYTLAGAVLGFQLTVTDNIGATHKATVAHSVLPCTERALIDGSWVPAALRTL